jgi:uncharacterized protein
LFRIILLALALFIGAIPRSAAVEVPPLKESINDFAHMMPEASAQDLAARLKRFRAETGHTIVILTLPTLADEDMGSFGPKAFRNLALSDADLSRTVLLVVARTERKVGLEAGSELRHLFPEPAAGEKLLAHVGLYFDGLRPDLGIHAGVHYIFMAIKGEVHVDSVTEVERLEAASTAGGGAGAILALFLAPFLAFMVGGLWGIYATKFGLERGVRLIMGALLGYGAAKIVAILMGLISTLGTGLWYFLLALSIPLGVFASLTEFWMSGQWSDWSGIPRVKQRIRRKPEDNMGI